ncbi:MAG TPA: ABC transporter permease [Vicinamibacterales bacterium]|nr:ABC transporter permease [Vicinamibacterales bacterium]
MTTLPRFLARRCAEAVPLLMVVSVLVFALIHAAPGGPLAIYLANPQVRPADIERLRRALGLDRPLWQQYWTWLWAFAQGDWGYSFSDGRPVVSRIAERLPATLELVGVSLAGALLVTMPVGIITAVRRGRWVDRVATLASIAGLSIPAFWFGLLLQIVFAIGLGWLPSSGRATPGSGDAVDRLQHLVLPTVVLAIVLASGWSRYLRGSMLDTLAQPFILSTLARGLPPRRVILRHALRNALGPLMALVTVDAALLVSGAVVTESVFAWPGLGSLFTEALARRDYTVLMALLMLSASAVVVFNIVADFAHALVDPRIPAS